VRLDDWNDTSKKACMAAGFSLSGTTWIRIENQHLCPNEIRLIYIFTMIPIKFVS
jgi:hypothetical protein